jgi:hypothetical protein
VAKYISGAADQIRVRDQYEDGEGARNHGALIIRALADEVIE